MPKKKLDPKKNTRRNIQNKDERKKKRKKLDPKKNTRRNTQNKDEGKKIPNSNHPIAFPNDNDNDNDNFLPPPSPLPFDNTHSFFDNTENTLPLSPFSSSLLPDELEILNNKIPPSIAHPELISTWAYHCPKKMYIGKIGRVELTPLQYELLALFEAALEKRGGTIKKTFDAGSKFIKTNPFQNLEEYKTAIANSGLTLKTNVNRKGDNSYDLILNNNILLATSSQFSIQNAIINKKKELEKKTLPSTVIHSDQITPPTIPSSNNFIIPENCLRREQLMNPQITPTSSSFSTNHDSQRFVRIFFLQTHLLTQDLTPAEIDNIYTDDHTDDTGQYFLPRGETYEPIFRFMTIEKEKLDIFNKMKVPPKLPLKKLKDDASDFLDTVLNSLTEEAIPPNEADTGNNNIANLPTNNNEGTTSSPFSFFYHTPEKEFDEDLTIRSGNVNHN